MPVVSWARSASTTLSVGQPAPPGDACWRIQVCMAIAAAAPALIDRVEPNCAIDNVVSQAARMSSVSPGPSWPKTSTHALRQLGGLDRHRPGQVVDTDAAEARPSTPGREVLDSVVVAHVLVAVGDHRAAPVPTPPPDDVHLGGQERVRRPDHRADVEVVLPVLDRDVEGVPP